MKDRTIESATSQCPKCESKMVVALDTRESSALGFKSIRRRRMCIDCKERWTTQEVSECVLDDIQHQLKAVAKFNDAVKYLFGNSKKPAQESELLQANKSFELTGGRLPLSVLEKQQQRQDNINISEQQMQS